MRNDVREPVVALGLLTDAEKHDLAWSNESNYHVLVEAWLCAAVTQGIEAKRITQHGIAEVFYLKLSGFRVAVADLGALGATYQPNQWTSLMRLVGDALIFLFVFGAPFTAFIYDAGRWLGPLHTHTIFTSTCINHCRAPSFLTVPLSAVLCPLLLSQLPVDCHYVEHSAHVPVDLH